MYVYLYLLFVFFDMYIFIYYVSLTYHSRITYLYIYTYISMFVFEGCLCLPQELGKWTHWQFVSMCSRSLDLGYIVSDWANELTSIFFGRWQGLSKYHVSGKVTPQWYCGQNLALVTVNFSRSILGFGTSCWFCHWGAAPTVWPTMMIYMVDRCFGGGCGRTENSQGQTLPSGWGFASLISPKSSVEPVKLHHRRPKQWQKSHMESAYFFSFRQRETSPRRRTQHPRPDRRQDGRRAQKAQVWRQAGR